MRGGSGRKNFFWLGVGATACNGSIRRRKSKQIQALFFDFLCSEVAGFAGLKDLALAWALFAPPPASIRVTEKGA
jgi:hypothetical protein